MIRCRGGFQTRPSVINMGSIWRRNIRNFPIRVASQQNLKYPVQPRISLALNPGYFYQPMIAPIRDIVRALAGEGLPAQSRLAYAFASLCVGLASLAHLA